MITSKKPTLFKSESIDMLATIESRRDKKGDIYFYVRYPANGVEAYARFRNMTSVMDFLHSNFV